MLFMARGVMGGGDELVVLLDGGPVGAEMVRYAAECQRAQGRVGADNAAACGALRTKDGLRAQLVGRARAVVDWHAASLPLIDLNSFKSIG
ncbi:hypothetical protein [Streptomyces melanogenes]|uniref:Uncharacterized protein n=1 Tax=Streptomyces melanogenes TaxID=67326 RepID=A0ABZ1XBI8_9ACTN|nr:hypothetical protein [Streptomyces melanogenes]